MEDEKNRISFEADFDELLDCTVETRDFIKKGLQI